MSDQPPAGDQRDPSAESEATKQVLGDFELLERIGEGGSAVVYRAVNRTFNGVVALKRWRSQLTAGQRRKFLQECNLQWKLSEHPNIVRLYWADAPQGEPPWLATELYDDSLANRLLTEPALTRTEASDVADDLLAGLAAIHAENMLHRDVKPANVLLKGGTAALGDLGISMHLDGWTRDVAAGTDAFLAPEVARGGPPSIRSDLYSAAVTIRYLFGADLPAEVDAVLIRAASHNPGDRPESADALRAALRIADEAAATAPGTADSPPPPRPPGPALPPAAVTSPAVQTGTASGTEARSALSAVTAERLAIPAVATPVPPKAQPSRGVLIAVGGLALVVLAVAGWWALHLPRSVTGTPTVAVTSTAVTPAGTPSRAPASATPAPTARATIPAGYRLVHATGGLSVRIPAGWVVKPAGQANAEQRAVDPDDQLSYVQFGGYTTVHASQLQRVRDYEQAKTRTGYLRLKLAQVAYGQADDAVDWEYTFRSTREWHAYGRYWRVGGREYVLYALAPQAAWLRTFAVFQVMLRTAAPQ